MHSCPLTNSVPFIFPRHCLGQKIQFHNLHMARIRLTFAFSWHRQQWIILLLFPVCDCSRRGDGAIAAAVAPVVPVWSGVWLMKDNGRKLLWHSSNFPFTLIISFGNFPSIRHRHCSFPLFFCAFWIFPFFVVDFFSSSSLFLYRFLFAIGRRHFFNLLTPLLLLSFELFHRLSIRCVHSPGTVCCSNS